MTGRTRHFCAVYVTAFADIPSRTSNGWTHGAYIRAHKTGGTRHAARDIRGHSGIVKSAGRARLGMRTAQRTIVTRRAGISSGRQAGKVVNTSAHTARIALHQTIDRSAHRCTAQTIKARIAWASGLRETSGAAVHAGSARLTAGCSG
jgi:hypothetical protein